MNVLAVRKRGYASYLSSAQLGIASAPRLMCGRVCRFSPEWFHGISCRLAEVVPAAELWHRLCTPLKGKGKVYGMNAFWCQKLLKLGHSLASLFMFVHPKWPSHVRSATHSATRLCTGVSSLQGLCFQGSCDLFVLGKHFSLCSQQFRPGRRMPVPMVRGRWHGGLWAPTVSALTWSSQRGSSSKLLVPFHL